MDGAHRGDARAAHRTQAAQQLERGVERVAGRRFEPREVVRIATPRQHVEDHGREIDAMNLRLGAGPKRSAASHSRQTAPAADAAGAPGPLIRGVLRDALELEAVDLRGPGRSAPPCAARCPRRRARPAPSGRSRRCWWPGSRGGVPRPSALRPVRRPAAPPWSGTTSLTSGDDGARPPRQRADLGRAGQKTQHVPADARARARRRGRHTELRRVVDLQGMRPAWHGDHRTAVEKAGQASASMVADITTMRRSSRASHACRASASAEVGVDAALVELVEDDGPEAGEQRVLLQPGGQDAFGREQHPCVRTELPLEADVPADFAAQRPAAFGRDTPRDRPRRHAARLQHDDRTVRGQRRRDARGLARPGVRGQHQGPSLPDQRKDVRNERIDRKRDHSRSAAAWSSRTARIAGTALAAQDTARSSSATPANVAGSSVLTCQTKLRRTRVAKKAATVPRTTPASASAEIAKRGTLTPSPSLLERP